MNFTRSAISCGNSLDSSRGIRLWKRMKYQTDTRDIDHTPQSTFVSKSFILKTWMTPTLLVDQRLPALIRELLAGYFYWILSLWEIKIQRVSLPWRTQYIRVGKFICDLYRLIMLWIEERQCNDTFDDPKLEDFESWGGVRSNLDTRFGCWMYLG